MKLIEVMSVSRVVSILSVIMLAVTSCSQKQPKVNADPNKTLVLDEKNKVTDSICLKAEQDASEDFNNKRAKFYFHSIAMPSEALKITCNSRLNVSLVSMGCIPQGYELCYNNVIDNLACSANKISVSALINSSTQNIKIGL